MRAYYMRVEKAEDEALLELQSIFKASCSNLMGTIKRGGIYAVKGDGERVLVRCSSRRSSLHKSS